VGTFHGHNGKQIDSMTGFRDFHGGRESCQSSTDNRDFHSITTGH
jgi:hypothetical protein